MGERRFEIIKGSRFHDRSADFNKLVQLLSIKPFFAADITLTHDRIEINEALLDPIKSDCVTLHIAIDNTHHEELSKSLGDGYTINSENRSLEITFFDSKKHKEIPAEKAIKDVVGVFEKERAKILSAHAEKVQTPSQASMKNVSRELTNSTTEKLLEDHAEKLKNINDRGKGMKGAGFEGVTIIPTVGDISSAVRDKRLITIVGIVKDKTLIPQGIMAKFNIRLYNSNIPWPGMQALQQQKEKLGGDANVFYVCVRRKESVGKILDGILTLVEEVEKNGSLSELIDKSQDKVKNEDAKQFSSELKPIGMVSDAVFVKVCRHFFPKITNYLENKMNGRIMSKDWKGDGSGR